MSQSVALTAQMQAGLETPTGKLWFRQVIIVLLVLVLGIATYRTYDFLASVTQTVGRDAVPSIVAAEKIRTTLAYAHTNLANVFLANEKADGPSSKAYQKAMEDALDNLLTAAQNITYGDDERKPILAMMSGLAEYERLVGAALHTGHYDQSAAAADVLMREKILPAAVQLDQANFARLDASYQQFKEEAAARRQHVIYIAGLLLVALIETQLHLFRRFRRLVNPPLALATILFAIGAMLFASHSGQELATVRSAKEDAFDSVHALSQTRAFAYGANAMESIYLLQTGNASNQNIETKRFVDMATEIWHGQLQDGNTLPTDLATLKGTGLLGDELANITFAGEKEAAIATLAGWMDYVRIDEQIRKLELDGKHADAVALCLGTRKGESDWAFEQFDNALTQTLKINEDAFGTSINKAFAHVAWLRISIFVMVLSVLVGSAIGFQMRLAEFRE